ncbi:hypothetical protein BDP27DRAFT_1418147 [Rhodocollybia butyracea]|uniref:Uncharacterized protein n=1 Tax=Rhodocollybia butyracea TaxID=206335 RepID=A0A9P5PTS8_9AGAR|nr:hypothetical protein BDP27DRAFT_1418147 [Rhodocollybia butyracea]
MTSSPSHIENSSAVSYSYLQTSESEDPPECSTGDSVSPPPLHVETRGTTMGYFSIISCYIGAGAVAVTNHILFSRLEGTLPGDHTKQAWVSSLKNIFPTIVALLLFTSLKTCLSQSALYRLCSGTYSVALVNLVTSPPSFLTALKTLVKSGLRRQVLEWAILGGMAQVITVTSIFVPGSLIIVSSPIQSTLLKIPMIDLNAVAPASSSIDTSSMSGSSTTGKLQDLSFTNPSQRWTRLLQHFSYFAPAINCTSLSRVDIWPNNNASTNSSLLAFPVWLDDPTISDQPTPQFTYYLSSSGLPLSPTLDLYYIEGFNTTSLIISSGGGLLNPNFNLSEYHPRGVHCGFQNATYEATTLFSQNGQISTTRIVEWSGSLPGSDGALGLPLSNVTNATMALFSIASVYAQVLNGNLTFDPENSGFPTIQAFDTPLFNVTSFTSTLTGAGILLSLSPDVSNLTDGLQSLLGNSTLALVGEGIATTWVNATVVPNSLQYQYHFGKLGLIYGIVFGVALLVVIDGLICLRANGTAANFEFQGIVEMTANSHGLHELAVLPRFADIPVRGMLGSSSSTRPILISDRDETKTETSTN